MPGLGKLNQEHGERFNLLMVQTRGSLDAGRELLAEQGIPTSSAAYTRSLHPLFEVRATPTTLLIDARGVVRRKVVGGRGHAFFAAELKKLQAETGSGESLR